MSKTSVFSLFILILTGMVVFALYRTNRLEPRVAMITGSGTSGQVTHEQPAAPDTAVPEVKPEPVTVVAETKPPEPVQITEIKKEPVRDEDPVSAKYRAKYKAPKVGAQITLSLSNNTKQSGILKEISDNGVKIKGGNYDITVPKDKLSAASLAICYEDEYVKFMVAQRTKALASNRNATAKKTADNNTEPEQTEPAQTEPIGEYAEHMKKTGPTDELIERKKRVKEMEAKMRAQGIDL